MFLSMMDNQLCTSIMESAWIKNNLPGVLIVNVLALSSWSYTWTVALIKLMAPAGVWSCNGRTVNVWIIQNKSQSLINEYRLSILVGYRKNGSNVIYLFGFVVEYVVVLQNKPPPLPVLHVLAHLREISLLIEGMMWILFISGIAFRSF